MYNGRAESPAENENAEVHTMKTKQELIEKAKKEWGETWNEGMIEYDADTLRCIGTKC